MLVLDVFVLIIILGVVFGGIAAGVHYQHRKKFDDPRQQLLNAASYDREKGQQNMLRLQLQEGQRCFSCKQLCNPDQDLVLEDLGAWFHKTCYENELKGN